MIAKEQRSSGDQGDPSTNDEMGGEPIIQTRIVRPPVRNVVHRTRLYELLDRGATRRLTIVSAPAGYGKTTLVSSWIGERSHVCCWVNLDRLDTSAQRLTLYLGAALDRLEKHGKLQIDGSRSSTRSPPFTRKRSSYLMTTSSPRVRRSTTF